MASFTTRSKGTSQVRGTTPRQLQGRSKGASQVRGATTTPHQLQGRAKGSAEVTGGLTQRYGQTSIGTAVARARDFRVRNTPYPLLLHLQAAAGKDPILLGATGYANDVFTSRMWGSTT